MLHFGLVIAVATVPQRLHDDATASPNARCQLEYLAGFEEMQFAG
jgi:hypothetical protein